MLLEKPRSGQQLGRSAGRSVAWLLALSLLAACGHAAGTADQDGDGSCLPVDGAIGGPPPTSCPNDFPPVTDCPDASPSYKTDVAPVVRDKCTVCHTPGGVEPVPVFGSYAEIHAQTTQNSVKSFIFTCRMPPTCAPQLTADERKRLLKWFACGALDN